MGHKFRFIALLLVALTIVPLFAVPASAAYSYPMSLTIYYKDEAGNTLKSPYTGSFNAADHEGLKWYAPSISGYALKNDSDATITYEMLDKSFPASNYVRNGTATYTVVYVKTYTHLVNYLRADNNVPIGSAARKTAKPGTSYSFTSPSVTGMRPSKSTVSGTIGSSNTSETVYYYPITYTISYNANGGSGAPSSQTKSHGTDITLTTAKPTRTGHTFLGWSISSTSASAMYSSGDTFTLNANTTLYAVWSAKKYTISYDANGGTGAPASQTKIYGLTMNLSTTKPTRSGYTFKGWGTTSTATSALYQPGDSYSANSNRTLYAVWEQNAPTTYTVSYNANGGSGAPASQTKTHNVALTLSSTKPTRSGYTFKGWATSSSATTVSYSAGGSYTRNASITLYAVWQCNHPTSTRTYITGCDWEERCNNCGVVTATGTTHGPYSYGAWAYYSTSQHRRTKACNYGDYSTYEYASHSTTTNYEEYSATQHKKYSYCDTCSSTVGSASYEAHSFTTTTSGGKVTKTCSKCGYTESEDQTYTISYNANGGSGAPASQTKTHGVTLTLSLVKPTRSGYTFMGWATSSSATSASYSAGGSYTANASRTLYAVWQCSHISYDIRYVTSCDWERVCSNCGLVLATGTTHGPYNYSGWIYSNELSHSRVKSCQYGDFSEIEFGAHSTTVKFESVSATQHKYYDSCADCNHMIGTESLESHSFVSRTENGRIYHECSLCGYSYSEAVTYTISYNANGGDGEPAAQFKVHGETLTLSSTIPTRDGYDFLGWATTSTATSASYTAGGSYTGNANATLYAVWQRSVYTVTYNANGGSGAPSAQTKYYGGTVTIPSTIPTRTNHVFIGWATTSAATSVAYNPGDNYTDDASITLYAVWMERNYDFSVSDIAIEPNEVRQYGTATIRFRTDNWDRNLPYDNIPVEVLLNGSVIMSKTVNFTAYGVQNIVFDLNVGALEGTQTLEARINWADHASETRTGNNSVMTTFNVIKVAETSTEIIDMHGEYVEGREVVTSFYVNNEGSSDILPSDHVSFDFRVYKMDGANEVTVFEQTWNDVVIPATGRNLVYFKWKVPDDSAGTTLFYRGTINAADASREENADNNAQESSVMVKRQVVSQTPNTRYEDKAPAGYAGNVAAPAHERGKATWNMWVYEGGSLVLKNYGIQVLTGNPVISPSSGCTTAVHEGGNVWTMKSGYGIQLLFSYVMTDVPGFVEPTEAAYTNPQNVYATFPEYRYSTTEGNYRTLEYDGGCYRFYKNPDAEDRYNQDARLHFIPIYVENGNYVVSITVTEFWTPVGMITAVENSNVIKIDGTIYDDWYQG